MNVDVAMLLILEVLAEPLLVTAALFFGFFITATMVIRVVGMFEQQSN